MLTYNQLIKQNRTFADNHYALKNFGNGERYNIVTHNQEATFKYPLMWMEDLPHTAPDGMYVMGWRIYFLDLVPTIKERGTDLQYTNENEVKSNMVQVCQDLISFWVQDKNNALLDIERNFNITTITDQLEDRVTGCFVDIKLTQPFNYNSCIIPMSGVDPAPSSNVVITINGSTFVTAACGVDEDIPVIDQDDNPVGSKVGANWVVNTAGSPAGNEVNGDAKTDIAGGTTKDFQIEYANGDPVVVTEVSDSATLFEGTIPDSVSGIAYVRNGWIVKNQNNRNYDLGWYLANDTKFDYNVTGVAPILDPCYRPLYGLWCSDVRCYQRQ